MSRNCSCAGVFKSLKPIFAENKHEIVEKNEISPLFVGKNFLFCRICCSAVWCNERPQNQIRNLITKEERISFLNKISQETTTTVKFLSVFNFEKMVLTSKTFQNTKLSNTIYLHPLLITLSLMRSSPW